jgi:para-nitrobenzyl esterase
MLLKMNSHLRALLAIALISVTACITSSVNAAADRQPTADLRIDSGMIRGLVVGDKKDIRVYKGIPYAAPPVGGLRWKPPLPPANWQGVRDCFEFGAACPQVVPLLLVGMPEMVVNARLSEDCLYLNVWAPAGRATQKLPVLYWIHGGGFVVGAASQPIYDGEELARLGCIVVSVNYRLGLFGFLAHPALSAESIQNVSGNYGLLDQIEGLRWVKRNIGAFGGDPDRVTIFGESAGGISVDCLMVTPAAKGLFHGAIAQSATALKLPRLRTAVDGHESAEQAGWRAMAACGLDASATAAQMRQLDAATLSRAIGTEPGVPPPMRLQPLFLECGPLVDGQVIPDEPMALFAAGHEHPVPLMVGSTRNEMSLLLLGSRVPADQADYLKQLQENLGGLAAAVAAAYPVHDADSVRPAVIQLTTDLNFALEARSIARAHSAAGHPTFRYQFSRPSKRAMLELLGAHHGAELLYLFQRPLGGSADDLRLSRALGQYWINFAASGNPNGDGLATWPAYHANAEQMIDFAKEVKIMSGYRNGELDLMEKVASR